jgi:hypothetical protein
MLAVFAAFMIAAAIVGFMLLRALLVAHVVEQVVTQKPYEFPTPAFQLTPFAIGTPITFDFLYDFDMSTPTPHRGDIYIRSPQP